MCGMAKTWSDWWLAILAALVLMTASIGSSHAHGPGHTHHQHAVYVKHAAPHAHWGDLAQHAKHSVEIQAIAVKASGHGGHWHHHHGGLDHSDADCGCCCDTICHCGFAILGFAGELIPAPEAVLFYMPVALPGGTLPGSLDRPPRSPVLA